MTNAAIISIDDAVLQTLVAFKGDASKRAIKLIIEDEQLKAADTIAVSGTYQADFDSLQDNFEPKSPAFMIVRLEKTIAHPEFVLIVFIPTGCPVRPRTIFASARVPVQRRLSQIFTGIVDYFIDDIKELVYDTFINVSKKDSSAMSLDELREKEDAQEATVGQVQLPTHDTFTWPVDDELQGLLKTFASGSGPRVVAGKASDTGGAISLAGTGEALGDINNSGPRYIAIRYNDNGTEIKVFMLYCPDTAPARQKMMSSTCKHSFLKGCKEAGLEFDKTFEVRDVSEFTDAHLDVLVNPPAVDHGYGEIKVHKKPSRPGRR